MKKVLIVDDSRFMQEEIRHILEGSAFEVVCCCRDAEEALACYTEYMPDVVLMDIVLPGIDGIEATQALLAKWPEAYVIIISSLAYDDTIARATECGAKNILFKPFDKKQMLEVLDAIP